MKKYKFFRHLLFIPVIIVLFSSCYQAQLDENGNNGDLTLNDYLKLLSKPTLNGSVIIQNSFEMDNVDQTSNIVISEQNNVSAINFYNSEDNQILIVGSTDQELNQSLFGKNLKFKVGDNNSNLYVPLLLRASMTTEYDFLDSNASVVWNADTNNNKGVIIWVTYKPTNQPNLSILNDNKHFISQGVLVKDEGQFKFTNQMLERFPKNAKVDVNIVRFAYYIENDKPSIVVMSSSSYEARIRKD